MRKSYSTRLRIPEYPDSSAVPANLYDIISSIYQSLRALAEAADVYSGGSIDSEVAPSEDKRTSCIYDRLCTVSTIAGEAIEYGQLVNINSDGKAYKSDVSTELGGYKLSKIAGFAGASVKQGELLTICIKGLFAVSGLTAGQDYFPVYFPSGYDGRITDRPPILQTGPEGWSFGKGEIGTAMTEELVLFEGVTT